VRRMRGGQSARRRTQKSQTIIPRKKKGTGEGVRAGRGKVSTILTLFKRQVSLTSFMRGVALLKKTVAQSRRKDDRGERRGTTS